MGCRPRLRLFVADRYYWVAGARFHSVDLQRNPDHLGCCRSSLDSLEYYRSTLDCQVDYSSVSTGALADSDPGYLRNTVELQCIALVRDQQAFYLQPSRCRDMGSCRACDVFVPSNN